MNLVYVKAENMELVFMPGYEPTFIIPKYVIENLHKNHARDKFFVDGVVSWSRSVLLAVYLFH